MKYIKISLILLLTGCSSVQHNPQIGQSQEELMNGDEILSASDGSKSFPAWAYDEPRFIKDNKIYVSGSVEINGDQSPSRGLDAALLIAKSNLAAEIRDRLQSQTQYAAEGLGIDSQVLQQIINQESSVENLRGAYQVKRWYAKVKVPAQNSILIRYRCFALIGLPLDLYKEQVAEALKSIGPQLSHDFKEKVNLSWNRFFGSNALPVQNSNRENVKPDNNISKSDNTLDNMPEKDRAY